MMRCMTTKKMKTLSLLPLWILSHTPLLPLPRSLSLSLFLLLRALSFVQRGRRQSDLPRCSLLTLHVHSLIFLR